MGSGRTTLTGYFNIDVAISERAKRPPDLLCDFRRDIPLPDACADEILGIHVWEHIDRWECDDVIEEWRRLLRPNGRLALEMPDLMKCCHNILHGCTGEKVDGQLGMWGLFGDPTHRDPLMMHKWGWTFNTLAPFLRKHHFHEIQQERTQFHFSGRDVRDFRIIARKV